MFDIGFWEIALIAVVALLVVGPDEFPGLVRNIGAWIGKIRRFMTDTKNDLDREFSKAEELKQLMEREASLASLHENIDARKIVTDTVVGKMGSTESGKEPADEQQPASESTKVAAQPVVSSSSGVNPSNGPTD